METIYLLLIKNSICLFIGYLFYIIFLSKSTNFIANRIFLIALLILSLSLPFNSFSFHFSFFENGKTHIETFIATRDLSDNAQVLNTDNKDIIIESQSMNKKSSVDYFGIAKTAYLIITSIFLMYLLLSVAMAIRYILMGKMVKRNGNIRIIHSSKTNKAFSFFNYIVLNPEGKTNTAIEQITHHEIVHARQLHSFDLLLSGVVSAILWFNPIVWLIRRSLTGLHEYLADRNVLKNGMEVKEYQKMLYSIITEERLAGLSSSFNQSQIKKRLIMMKKKSTQHTNLRILWAIPMVILVFIVMSGFNPLQEGESPIADTNSVGNLEITDQNENVGNALKAVVAPVKMNVVYQGVENPVSIAVSGIPIENLGMGITNGTIKGEDGNYIVSPRRVGNLVITVYDGNKEIGNKMFRVHRIPDTIATVAGKKGGAISKDILLSQPGIVAKLDHFDFDVKFKVVEFNVSAIINGFFRIYPSKNEAFSKEQKDLINSLEKGSKVYIEDIKAIGPDGVTRELSAIALVIQ